VRRNPAIWTGPATPWAAWREDHPAGTADDLVVAVGPAFHPDWAVVLRSVLFAADRHRARRITGVVPGSAGTLR
jgi:hypothetical protein